MPGILSQQEIDSLLSGTAAPKVEEPDGQRREIVRFDFRLPHRMSKRQLQTFHAVHDSFAESFSSHLVARLQTTVTMSVVSVDQIFYSEYVLSTLKPSSLYIFRIGHSDAMAVMELSPELVLAIIARLLGGTSEGRIEARTITKIEQNIIRGIVHRALADLAKAWQTIIETTFALERYETEGDFIQIAPTSEIVLVVSFEITVSKQRYLMNICFPTFALEDVLAQMNIQNYGHATRSTEHAEWTKNILAKLETTTIPARCILGETRLTLAQIMELEVGDVLLTDTPINGELKIVLGEKVRAKGRPGISSGKKAVRVTDITTENHHG